MIVAVGYAFLIFIAIIVIAVARLLAESIREVSKWERRNR